MIPEQQKSEPWSNYGDNLKIYCTESIIILYHLAFSKYFVKSRFFAKLQSSNLNFMETILQSPNFSQNPCK